jgi:hypothetical protein
MINPLKPSCTPVFFRYEWIVLNILMVMSRLPPALGLWFKRWRERKAQAA